MRLSKKTREALALEVVPSEARLEFTRIIRDKCQLPEGDDDGGIAVLRENEFINIANQVMGNSIYVLVGSAWGDYHPAEHAWHHGQRELIMRLPSTPELAEILADYLQRGMMRSKQVNDILSHYNCGFSFRDIGGQDRVKVSVEIISEDAIPEADLSNDHANVRKLAARMDAALAAQDYAAVLHASASIFETLAKDVMQNPLVSDKPLGGFFSAYKMKSRLPEPILDYMLAVYKNRNTQPLAGHGSLSPPKINAKEAVVLCEMTKSIVRMERNLAERKIELKKAAPSTSPVSAKPATAIVAPTPSQSSTFTSAELGTTSPTPSRPRKRARPKSTAIIRHT